MRASEARAHIATAVMAATLDTRAGVADRMVEIKVAQDPSSAAERSFRITCTTPPHRGTLTTCDAYVVDFELVVFYPWSPEVEDRVCDDAERIEEALADEALVALDADFVRAEVVPSGIATSAHLVTVRWSLVVYYRQDSAVVGA